MTLFIDPTVVTASPTTDPAVLLGWLRDAVDALEDQPRSVLAAYADDLAEAEALLGNVAAKVGEGA